MIDATFLFSLIDFYTLVHLPYCVISLAATIEDGMVYKAGHSADGSEACMLDGTDKSLQN